MTKKIDLIILDHDDVIMELLSIKYFYIHIPEIKIEA